jgi:hypothetical protein
MRATRRRTWLLAGAGLVVALAIAIPSGAARAQTLAGNWAAFDRCPVTATSMEAADGVNIYDVCVDSNSTSGSITLGDTTVTLGDSDLQDGVLVNTNETAASGERWTTVDPSGGAVVAPSETVPGGLLGLMCPSDIILVTALCDDITDSALNTVTATIEPAGSTSDFRLGAALGATTPIITIPVKIQLSNSILGDDCYIGSDSDPIDLTITNSAGPPNDVTTDFDADGATDANGVLQLTQLSGAGQVDSSFSVPGASGCGPLGIADPVLDLKEDLPGTGSLTLNDTTISVAGFVDPGNYSPDEGQDFAADYESAES